MATAPDLIVESKNPPGFLLEITASGTDINRDKIRLISPSSSVAGRCEKMRSETSPPETHEVPKFH
jgi:hypothetical protein